MHGRIAPPFRLSAPKASEDDFHAQVVRLLGLFVLPPAEWAAYPSGWFDLTPAQAAKQSRMGIQRGWPDFLISHRGFFGLELKRDGGALSTTRVVRTRRGGMRALTGQREMFARLRASGACVAVARTTDEVLLQLDVWEVPLRGGWRSAVEWSAP